MKVNITDITMLTTILDEKKGLRKKIDVQGTVCDAIITIKYDTIVESYAIPERLKFKDLSLDDRNKVAYSFLKAFLYHNGLELKE